MIEKEVQTEISGGDIEFLDGKVCKFYHFIAHRLNIFAASAFRLSAS